MGEAINYPGGNGIGDVPKHDRSCSRDFFGCQNKIRRSGDDHVYLETDELSTQPTLAIFGGCCAAEE